MNRVFALHSKHTAEEFDVFFSHCFFDCQFSTYGIWDTDHHPRMGQIVITRIRFSSSTFAMMLASNCGYVSATPTDSDNTVSHLGYSVALLQPLSSLHAYHQNQRADFCPVCNCVPATEEAFAESLDLSGSSTVSFDTVYFDDG